MSLLYEPYDDSRDRFPLNLITRNTGTCLEKMVCFDPIVTVVYASDPVELFSLAAKLVEKNI